MEENPHPAQQYFGRVVDAEHDRFWEKYESSTSIGRPCGFGSCCCRSDIR
jgi:hypothetical protein